MLLAWLVWCAVTTLCGALGGLLVAEILHGHRPPPAGSDPYAELARWELDRLLPPS